MIHNIIELSKVHELSSETNKKWNQSILNI